MRRMVALVLGVLAVGCVRRYQEPPAIEPHALVELRVLHHGRFGGSLDEVLRLDGHDVAIPPGGVRTVRVRPVASSYHFVAEYSHTELRRRRVVRTERIRCGLGTNGRGCTRPVTRTVTDRVHVTDAACQARVPHVPMAGATYVVQFDFYGPDSCAARCFRQIDRPGGGLELWPCGPGEPAASATSGSESPAAASPYDASVEVRALPASHRAPPVEGAGRDLASPR